MTTRFIKNALITGIPFGLAMGLVIGIQDGLTLGAISGLVCALLFGAAMAGFLEFQKKKMERQNLEFEGKEIIFQGAANHFLKGEGRGGWLTLTSDQLMFRSHGKNLQNQPLDISLAEIGEAEATRTLGIIPNGLRVALKNKRCEKFVVQKRKEWAEKISALITEDK